MSYATPKKIFTEKSVEHYSIQNRKQRETCYRSATPTMICANYMIRNI